MRHFFLRATNDTCLDDQPRSELPLNGWYLAFQNVGSQAAKMFLVGPQDTPTHIVSHIQTTPKLGPLSVWTVRCGPSFGRGRDRGGRGSVWVEARWKCLSTM